MRAVRPSEIPGRGIEFDPRYVDVIVRRYEEITGKPAVLEATGERFAALEKRRAAAEPSSGSEPGVSA